jgi:pyruvate kinase
MTNHDDLAKPTSDPYLAVLQQLLLDVGEIREKVVEKAEIRLKNYKHYYRAGVYSKSAVNLAHYLALRQFDLRDLQLRLAQVGLSSLGRAESAVLPNLDAVLDILHRATDKNYQYTGKNSGEYGPQRAQQLLEQHTIELFGSYFEKSKAHVMVTLAPEAAWDYELVITLLNKGMTCARINCAHDNPIIWQSMIRNIRRAEVESNRSCRILMDLAGPKIRTGEIELGPAIQHIRIKRDAYGQCLKPGKILLCNAEYPDVKPEKSTADLFRIAIPAKHFRTLTPGQYLVLTDARNKTRKFLIQQALSATEFLATTTESCYLQSGCEVRLYSEASTKAPALAKFNLGSFQGAPKQILLYKNDFLLLTAADQLGAPASYDDQQILRKPAQITCTLATAIKRLKIGDPVWIDDGKLGAVVENILEQGVLLRVIRARAEGVTISSDKGINFPETTLALPPLSEKDLEDLDFICAHADLVGFSFVQTLADMDCLIAELAKRGATDLPIIAKIETNPAVKNLPDIILGALGRHSLGIMIARGDLAVELGSARLAEIQEELLWLCEAAHVPVIWATQVLESIAKKGVKSRPEFTDAAMAVRADCVMLNKGPYIIDALEALINVMIRMQEHQHKKFPRLRALHW